MLNLAERSCNQHRYQARKKQIMAKMEADLGQLRDFYSFDQAAVCQRHKIALARGIKGDINMSSLVAGENRNQLAPIELSLLITFLRHRGEVLSSEEIFRQVYGKEPAGEDPGEIARAMVHCLRKKFSVALSSHPLIRNIHGEGCFSNSSPVDTASEENGERWNVGCRKLSMFEKFAPYRYSNIG